MIKNTVGPTECLFAPNMTPSWSFSRKDTFTFCKICTICEPFLFNEVKNILLL